MSSVKMPSQIEGKWIFPNSLRKIPDTVVLMRHLLDAKDLAGDMTLWIAASSFYLLYINGRLVGAGPRAHQTPGCHFVDTHDVGCFLEQGKNMIAVQVYSNCDPERGDFSRLPGLWCQLCSGSQTVLCSDESWEVFSDPALTGPRAKVTPGGHPAGFCNIEKLPINWNMPDGDSEGWGHPDLVVDPGSAGVQLELHLTPPAAVDADRRFLHDFCSGQAAVLPNWSAVNFPEDPAEGTYGAVSSLYSEYGGTLKVLLNTDYAFRFFCNRELLASGKSAREKEVLLHLQSGWNRLTFFMRPVRHGMGAMFIFPAGENVPLPLYERRRDSIPGWRIAGPLRIELEETTPAVRIEQYASITQQPQVEELRDIFDWISHCRLCSTQNSAALLLRSYDFAVYKLDTLRYGFVNINFKAGAGDRVDLLIGNGWDEENCFPKFAHGNDRQVLSCICKEGENQLTAQVPCDCFYVLLFVRQSARGISNVECSFDEFSCSVNHECSFKSDDPLLNRLWETGRNALLRSSSSVTPVEGRVDDDCFLLDAYLDAANISAVFGDAEYAALRLRQFASAQLEDGSIPPLSFGGKHAVSPVHGFFFPIWLLYNYRVSGNLIELRNLLPNLNALREYLESLLNEEQNFIEPGHLPAADPNDSDPVSSNRTSTVVNALLCRFMLSAKEVYTQLECRNESSWCGNIAHQVSTELIRRCYDENQKLFADEPLSSGTIPRYSLLGNFFAILCGCRMKECFDTFFAAFFDAEKAEAKAPEADSPYFHFLFMEMMCAIRQQEWALRYFRNFWQRRLAPEGDTWLENPGTGVIRTSGFNCGAGMVPNVFMVREILGVRVADPGHAVIYFNPAFTQYRSAEATIPTVRGRLWVKWVLLDDGGLDITIDASFQIKVVPELSEEMLHRSIFRLGENIILLQPHK